MLNQLKNLKKKIITHYSSEVCLANQQERLLRQRYGNGIECLNPKEQKYLQHITTVLDRLDQPIKTVYDIGANRGIWAEAFALYTSNIVYAFEPLPAMVAELCRRKERCPLIEIQPVACGNVQQRMKINEEEHKVEASSLLALTDIGKQAFHLTKLGQSHKIEIDVVRLDDWGRAHQLPQPSLIKLDVQGYELQVLEGGWETFKRARYVWVELCFQQIYAEGSTFEILYEALRKANFQFIDCVELVRSQKNDQLVHIDGIFRNASL